MNNTSQHLLLVSAFDAGYGVVAAARRCGKTTALFKAAEQHFHKNKTPSPCPRVLFVRGFDSRDNVNAPSWGARFAMTTIDAGCPIDWSDFDLVLVDEVFEIALQHRAWLKKLHAQAKHFMSIGTFRGSSNIDKAIEPHDELEAISRLLGVSCVSIYTSFCYSSQTPEIHADDD